MRDRKFNFPPIPMVDCGGKMRSTKIPHVVVTAMRIPSFSAADCAYENWSGVMPAEQRSSNNDNSRITSPQLRGEQEGVHGAQIRQAVDVGVEVWHFDDRHSFR